MDKLRQFPKTKYGDLVSYGVELHSLYKAHIGGKKILGYFQEVDEKEIYTSLIKKIEDLKKKYSEKLDKNDFYEFDSLNDLEKFIINLNYFSEFKIKKSISKEIKTISNAVDNDLFDIYVGCWFVKNNFGEMDYIFNTKIGFKDEKEIDDNLENLV